MILGIEKHEVKFRQFSNLCISLNHILLQLEGFSYTPHSDNIRILIIGRQVSRKIKPSYSYIVHGSTDFFQQTLPTSKLLRKSNSHRFNFYKDIQYFHQRFLFCKPFFSNLGIKKEPRRVLFL